MDKSSSKVILLGISLVVIGAIFFFFNKSSVIAPISQESPTTINSQVVPKRTAVTMKGEYTCLPHKDTSGPQTMECALGFKSDAGDYYLLDTNLVQATVPELKTGDKFSANGMITPIEELSTDQWKTYNVKGVFSVSDSFKKL